MAHEHSSYIPALRFHWLTRLYDRVLRWTMPETVFRLRLLDQAGLRGGHRVLDVGCGTATLTLLVKNACPGAEVVGLDGDPKVLDIARKKAEDTGLTVTFDQGMAYALPYPDGSFDRVLSSLVFHHLVRDEKTRALREAFRVLRPGGELHLADWGKAQDWLQRGSFLLVQLLDGFASTRDNVNGLLPDLVRAAGFDGVDTTASFRTVYGTLSLWRARKPWSQSGQQPVG